MRDADIKAYCEAAIRERVFPGCVVGYIQGDSSTILPFGRLTYDSDAPATTARTVYDVASITKAIPTACVILKLAEDGLLELDDKVVDYLPELTMSGREHILIRHLLTFTVAFELGQTMANIARERPEQLLEAIFKAPPLGPPGAAYLYTNAPSLLLGLIAERRLGEPLDEIAQKLFFGPLAMTRTTFRPAESIPRDEIAPSAVDWRGEVRGEVHDPGAWALMRQGEVPGHAGLFSTVDDLLMFVRMLLGKGAADGERLFKPETIRSMHTNQTPNLETTTGLGWAIGPSDAHGIKVSPQAFGRTGFTGTMVLIDPTQRVGLVLLSNRTYPDVGDRERIRGFWRGLADIVFAGGDKD